MLGLRDNPSRDERDRTSIDLWDNPSRDETDRASIDFFKHACKNCFRQPKNTCPSKISLFMTMTVVTHVNDSINTYTAAKIHTCHGM